MKSTSIPKHRKPFHLTFKEIGLLLDLLRVRFGRLVGGFEKEGGSLHFSHRTALSSLHFSDTGECLSDVSNLHSISLIGIAFQIGLGLHMCLQTPSLDIRTIELDTP